MPMLEVSRLSVQFGQKKSSTGFRSPPRKGSGS